MDEQTLFLEASFSVGLVRSMVDAWIPQEQATLSITPITAQPQLYHPKQQTDKAAKKLEAIKLQVELSRLKKLEDEVVKQETEVKGF